MSGQVALKWTKAGVKNVKAIYTGYFVMRDVGFQYIESDGKVHYVDSLGKKH